jgi:hypothetical protein
VPGDGDEAADAGPQRARDLVEQAPAAGIEPGARLAEAGVSRMRSTSSWQCAEEACASPSPAQLTPPMPGTSETAAATRVRVAGSSPLPPESTGWRVSQP